MRYAGLKLLETWATRWNAGEFTSGVAHQCRFLEVFTRVPRGAIEFTFDTCTFDTCLCNSKEPSTCSFLRARSAHDVESARSRLAVCTCVAATRDPANSRRNNLSFLPELWRRRSVAWLEPSETHIADVGAVLFHNPDLIPRAAENPLTSNSTAFIAGQHHPRKPRRSRVTRLSEFSHHGYPAVLNDLTLGVSRPQLSLYQTPLPPIGDSIRLSSYTYRSAG